MDKIKRRYFTTTKRSNKLHYGLLLIFSIVINGSFGYPSTLTYPFTLFFLLLLILKLNRQLYIAVTLFLALLAAAYFPIGQIFGRPNYTVISAAFYTNKGEARSFLSTIPILYCVGSVLILALWGFVARLPTLVIKKTKLILAFVLISILFTPLKMFFQTGKLELTQIGFTPIKFIVDCYKNSQYVSGQYKAFERILNKKDSWKIVSVHPKYQTYILVIGESVRADFMSKYGFGINDTPFVNQSAGVFFNNYLSAGPATVISLTHTLDEHSDNKIQLQNNIITLANKGGFATWWISNQGYLGPYDTPISGIGHDANTAIFLQMKDLERYKDAQDKEMLPFIKSALNAPSKKPKLIVIHLIGSHPPACDRTKGQFSVFFHSNDLSCYVQSIHNTDTLLKNITALANSTGSSWSMMYFADHGLARQTTHWYNLLNKEMLKHNDKYQQNYRVPMFIISSNDTQQKTITAYRSALNFLFLFSQWTGIKAQGLKTTCNYLSNQSCENQTNVILMDDKTKKDINSLPLDTIK